MNIEDTLKILRLALPGGLHPGGLHQDSEAPGWVTNDAMAIRVSDGLIDGIDLERFWQSHELAKLIASVSDSPMIPAKRGLSNPLTLRACECKGAPVRCSRCSGRREVACPHRDRLMDCEQCDGLGEYKCQACTDGEIFSDGETIVECADGRAIPFSSAMLGLLPDEIMINGEPGRETAVGFVNGEMVGLLIRRKA